MSASSTHTDVTLRRPRRSDGAALHDFVCRSEALEANTRYAYLLLSTHFRDTSIVAEQGGRIAGFVAAYLLPARPDTIFVWQVGVAPFARRTGLARRMIQAILDRQDLEDVRCLEATVATSNQASRRLFESVAKALDTTCSRHRGFEHRDFGNEAHEDEILVRVGPWEIS